MAGRNAVMTVTVVTDSAATIPPTLATELGIFVVPLRIQFEGRSLKDGAVSDRELLASIQPVTTSGPSPADFSEVLTRSGSKEGTLILTVAHDMGASTFISARSAAEAAEHPVRVVDTATAAGGQGLVVLAAARAARRGETLDRVEAEARHVAERVRLVASIPSLDHLARSGHVPQAAAWAGRWIGLQPVIELRNGSVHPLRPVLSREAADRRMLEVWRSTKPAGAARLHVAALDALDPDRSNSLLTAVRTEVTPAEEFVGSFGTGMIVHSGPQVVGLAWWWDERPS